MRIDRMPARLRLFHIWQKIGRNPFRKKQDNVLTPMTCPSCGQVIDTPYCPHCGQPYAKRDHSFFHGSLDSIPFLNDDAMRTFTHLLLRPGYMIRDYMNGLNSRYIAPLTCLIIFYAFFTIMVGVLSPEVRYGDSSSEDNTEAIELSDGLDGDLDEEMSVNGIAEMLLFLKEMNEYAHLDQMPEKVDSKLKASIASIEGVLRSQGVFSFLWKLILLTLAMKIVFRKEPDRLSFSASATFASYILCQMCFFMMFALLTTFGRTHSLGAAIIAIIMIVDFVQFFHCGRRKAFKYVVRIGIQYYVLMGLALLLMAGVLALSFLSF